MTILTPNIKRKCVLNAGLFNQIDLICPKCRHIEGDTFIQSSVKLNEVFKGEGGFVLEGFFTCANTQCNSRYPILQGIPVVLKDINAWWSAQKMSVSHASVGSPEIRDYFDSVEQIEPLLLTEKNLISSYMDFHYGTDFDILDTFSWKNGNGQYWKKVIGMARQDGDVHYKYAIDLGCSVGRYTFELARFSDFAVGIDLDFNKVTAAARIQREGKAMYERRIHGRCFEGGEVSYEPVQNALFLVADALDPPFRAESFDLVAGLNVIDNVKIPLVLLGQMDALLRKGGTFILGAPYEWRTEIAEPTEWLESEDLDAPEMIRQVLEGKLFNQMGLKYEIKEEYFDIPWILRNHSRHYSVFLSHLIKARKE